MNYTLEEFNINKQTANAVLNLWVNFCLKSPPLPELQGKSLSECRESAVEYFFDNFFGKLCFFSPQNGFAVFGDGQKFLDNEIKAFSSKKVAVLFMGATTNGGFHSLRILKECFRRLKESHGYNVIAWNQNREFRRKPFERIMRTLGAKKIENCYYVEL